MSWSEPANVPGRGTALPAADRFSGERGDVAVANEVARPKRYDQIVAFDPLQRFEEGLPICRVIQPVLPGEPRNLLQSTRAVSTR